MCGGGNLLRGRDASPELRATSDRIGMMSTIMNAISLQNNIRIARENICSRIFSTIELDVVSKYNIVEIRDCAKNMFVILAGGLGCGFVSTDTALVVRGLELGCSEVIKVTKVGGVYDNDPKTNPSAKLLHKLTYSEALTKNAFDKCAIQLAMENTLPFCVMGINELAQHFRGEVAGTMICSE